MHFAELVSLAVSAGLGVEGALDEAVGSGEGPLFDELRRLLREGRLRGESASATISRLPAEVGTRRRGVRSPRRSRAAADHGTAVTQALRAQARALRERRRLELVEAAERAQVRMLLPGGTPDPAGLLRRRALPGSGAAASADRAMRKEVSQLQRWILTPLLRLRTSERGEVYVEYVVLGAMAVLVILGADPVLLRRPIRAVPADRRRLGGL